MTDNRSLFENEIAEFFITPTMIRSLIEFITSQDDEILISPDVFTSIRSPLRTLTSEVLASIDPESLARVVQGVSIPKDRSLKIPEIIQQQNITFDMTQIRRGSPSWDVMVRQRPYKDQVILNITPWFDHTTRRVRDGVTIQNHILRSVLVKMYDRQQYASSDLFWLSTACIRHLTRFYSMSLSALLTRLYNLSIAEQELITFIFTYVYIYHSMTLDNPSVIMSKTQDFLDGNMQQLGFYPRGMSYTDRSQFTREMCTMMEDVLKASGDASYFTLKDIVTAIHRLEIPRITEKTFDARIIMERTKTWGGDNMTSYLSLLYPPYWAYIIALVGSGQKVGLTYTMKTTRDLWKQLSEFKEELIRSPKVL